MQVNNYALIQRNNYAQSNSNVSFKSVIPVTVINDYMAHPDKNIIIDQKIIKQIIRSLVHNLTGNAKNSKAEAFRNVFKLVSDFNSRIRTITNRRYGFLFTGDQIDTIDKAGYQIGREKLRSESDESIARRGYNIVAKSLINNQELRLRRLEGDNKLVNAMNLKRGEKLGEDVELRVYVKEEKGKLVIDEITFDKPNASIIRPPQPLITEPPKKLPAKPKTLVKSDKISPKAKINLPKQYTFRF